MFHSWRKNLGFTLVEALVVSVLSSALILGCVSFLQVQIKSGLLVHEQDQLNHQFDSTFRRFHRSLERLRLPLGEASLELDDQRMTVRYVAGEQTRNCHGTRVLMNSRVVDRFISKSNVLSCLSMYTDQQGQTKRDQQPLLNAVRDFKVRAVHLSTETCIDAVDVYIALDAPLLSRQDQSYRIIYPKCSDVSDGENV